MSNSIIAEQISIVSIQSPTIVNQKQIEDDEVSLMSPAGIPFVFNVYEESSSDDDSRSSMGNESCKGACCTIF